VIRWLVRAYGTVALGFVLVVFALGATYVGIASAWFGISMLVFGVAPDWSEGPGLNRLTGLLVLTIVALVTGAFAQVFTTEGGDV
jgi:hypothetical protein